MHMPLQLIRGVTSRSLLSLYSKARVSSGFGDKQKLSRHYSTGQTVQVPCHSNGAITLNIHPSPSGELFAPTIIYFPPGPIVVQHGSLASLNQHAFLDALAASSNATVVGVNYRHGSGNFYPTPIHDALAGFDWVRERLAEKRGKIHKIGICGELVGGGLAAMLALTECRLGENRIMTAALNNPIVDWIFPDGPGQPHAVESLHYVEQTDGRKKRRKKTIPAWEAFYHATDLPASSLFEAREALFSKPESYFDPFASPTLFFRTPGVDVPSQQHQHQHQQLKNESITSEDVEDSFPGSSPKRRKAARVYPPSTTALRLPKMRLFLGETNLLQAQGAEFVYHLRRSQLRQEMKERQLEWSDYEAADVVEKELVASALEGRFTVQMLPGLGLWSTGDDKDHKKEEYCIENAKRVGQWLTASLDD